MTRYIKHTEKELKAGAQMCFPFESKEHFEIFRTHMSIFKPYWKNDIDRFGNTQETRAGFYYIPNCSTEQFAKDCEEIYLEMIAPIYA